MTREKPFGSNQQPVARAWRHILAPAFAFLGVAALAIVSAMAVFHTAYHSGFQPAAAVRGIAAGVALLALSWYLFRPFPLSTRWILSAYCLLLGAFILAGSLGRIGEAQSFGPLVLVVMAGLGLIGVAVASNKMAKRAKPDRTRAV